MPFDTDSESVERLPAALAAIAPIGFEIGSRRISLADTNQLHADERKLTSGMADSRRAEFATGRILMRILSGTDEPILRATNGAPILPAGVTGSLAHDRRYAVAAVTQRLDIDAVGIDIEPIDADALSHDEAALVVRNDDIVPEALAAFVMKEATYKAWSGLGGAMLGHYEVRVHCDEARFSSTVLRASAAAVRTEFSGVLNRAAGYWIALVVCTGGPAAHPSPLTPATADLKD